MRTVRSLYLKREFLKMPPLLHDDKPTSLDVAFFQLVSNVQVKVDGLEQKGEPKVKWV